MKRKIARLLGLVAIAMTFSIAANAEYVQTFKSGMTNVYHYLTIGQEGFNLTYPLYVNGTSYFTGVTTHVGEFDLTLATRPTGSYAYGFKMSGSTFLTGGPATKSYGIGILLDRPATAVATGDSNDALIRGSYNNYAANDTNFIMRGINMSLNNRSGGVMGFMDNLLGNQNKSGGTVGSITGLTLVPENYGTVSDLFGGLDVVMKNEGAVATKEFGVRVRNLNNSLATAVGSAYLVEDTGANIGFTYGLNLNGATIGTADLILHNGDTINNGAAGTVTFSGKVAASSIAISGISATALTVGGGITAGTGSVGIIDATGKIPALSSSYLANLSGANLTGIVNAGIDNNAAIAISKLATSGTLGASVIASSVAVGAIGDAQLAGSIPDSKLATISTGGKVSDSALSVNIFKYTAPVTHTTAELSVSTPTAVGELVFNSSITAWCQGNGTTSAGDWKLVFSTAAACQ